MASIQLIKPCNGYLNSFYGPRVHPLTGIKGTFHRGIDYTGAADDTIYAAAAGVVRFVDTDPKRTGFGKYIIIKHDGFETVYAHLSVVSVRKDQRVAQGQKIGVKGTTGNSTGMHLHFELAKGKWNNKYTTNVDPLPYIVDPEIKVVQQVLKDMNLYMGAIDGLHGPSSQAALKVFQKKSGLQADAVPGRGTMKAILEEKERLASKDWLEYDDRGEDVVALQEYLNKIGIPTTVNGHYSTDTKKAVIKFQEARGLTADGVYGKAGKAEMNKALKEGFTLAKPAPVVKPATKPKEDITVADILKFSTGEGKNALLVVLKRFEKKDPKLSDAWRKKAIEGTFTTQDALEVIFVAIERGYITGKVDTAALKEQFDDLQEKVGTQAP